MTEDQIITNKFVYSSVMHGLGPTKIKSLYVSSIISVVVGVCVHHLAFTIQSLIRQNTEPKLDNNVLHNEISQPY